MQSLAKIDMQSIADQTIKRPGHFLVTQRQREQEDQEWNPDTHQIIGYTLPQADQSKTISKKLKIKVFYRNKKKKIDKHKTIFFCNGDQYIFTKNKQQRFRKLNNMKNKDNPLHSDYWRSLLCFASDNFVNNCIQAYKPLLQHKWSQIQGSKQRRDFQQIVNKRKDTMIRKYGTDSPQAIAHMP